MTEAEMEMKAKELLGQAQITTIPVDLEKCASILNIDIHESNSLGDDESGNIMEVGKRKKLVVNAHHSLTRRRFTIAHEISHELLKAVVSSKDRKILSATLNRYSGKPEEERLCDLCAAEILLPSSFFKSDMKKVELGMKEIKRLAEKYLTSLTATGLRYARFCEFSCALIISEDNTIKYVKGSDSFKAKKCFIDIGGQLSYESFAIDLFKGAVDIKFPQKVPSLAWLSEYPGSINEINEDSIFLQEFNQVLSLIWFDDDEDEMTEELDGEMRFKR